MICTAHWERTGDQREAVRAGLCKDCLSGKPINRFVELKGNEIRFTGEDLVRQARLAIEHRERYARRRARG